MLLRWSTRAWLLLGVLMLSGCGHYGNFPVGGPSAAAPPAYHVVSKGETLYSIAWQYGLDYRTVARWNRISAPYTIYPGQRIYFQPKSARRLGPKQVRASSDDSEHTASGERAVSGQAQGNGKLSWRWPAQGRLISTFDRRNAARQGVDIAGKLGQPIYAAAAGKVVYSGSGLLGYGKLIIIKHNDTYLSAYAHNSRLLVKEDQEVKTGEQIADMGDSGADRVMLHFEIRRDGEPVNPLKYLPKRH